MKKSNLFVTFVFLALISVSYGQDVILLTNRAKIEAKEIVVKGKTIYYQDYNDNSGDVFTVSLGKIEYIQYASGEKVLPADIMDKRNSLVGLGNNLINFHILDFSTNNFTMSYERVIADGEFSLQFPVSLGYGDENSNLLLPPPFDEVDVKFWNRFSAGVGLNIFPTRQGKARYFFGPAIYGGSGVYYHEYYGLDNTYDNTGFVSFVVNNGLIISPISHFSLSLVGTIGARHFFDVEGGKTAATGKISFNLSYRF